MHQFKAMSSVRSTHSRTISLEIYGGVKLSHRTTQSSWKNGYPIEHMGSNTVTEAKDAKNIDLYMACSTLDRRQYSSILALINPDEGHPSKHPSKPTIDHLKDGDFPVLQYKVRELV